MVLEQHTIAQKWDTANLALTKYLCITGSGRVWSNPKGMLDAEDCGFDGCRQMVLTVLMIAMN